jgi:tetratricopeptide (TPR) repeat protein
VDASGRPALLGPRRSGPADPPVPEDVTPADLDRSVRSELRSLSKANADEVARHLVMTGRLLPDEPEQAYAHAMAAQRRAGRIAVVREIVGVAAYHAGRWAEALSELRAARRMSGSHHVLPLMADAERGLGRPERALDLAASPEASTLSSAEKVELAIVVSGARRDLGQTDAAVLTLQIPQLTTSPPQPYSARLSYAYADALLDAGRADEAVEWFARSAAADHGATTDADERLAELQGLSITDLEAADSDASDAGPEDTEPDDAGPDDAGPDDAGPDDAGPDGAGGAALDDD